MFLRVSIKGFLLLTLIFALWAGCILSTVADSRDLLSLPGLAVTDFTGNGLSSSDRELMSDLFAYLCAESSRYLVLERNERDKILRRKGRGAAKPGPLVELISLGNDLNVDFILSGQITAENGHRILELSFIDVSRGMITRHWLKEYPSVEQLWADARAVGEYLIADQPDLPAIHNRIFSSLSPHPVKERLLLIFPAAELDSFTASARRLENLLGDYLLGREDMTLSFSSLAYDPAAVDRELFVQMCRKQDCHSLLYLAAFEGGYSLVGLDMMGVEIFRLPVDSWLEGSAALALEEIGEAFDAAWPLLPPAVLAGEIQRANIYRQKLERALLNHEYLTRRLYLSISTRLTNPYFSLYYLTALNILSLELDGYWFWNDFIGSGGGYGIAWTYPAAFVDESIPGHPLLVGHEFRLTPLIVRTPGKVSGLFSLNTSLNYQPYIEITKEYEEVFYNDILPLWFFKMDLRLGMIVNIDRLLSIYVNLISGSIAIPLKESFFTDLYEEGASILNNLHSPYFQVSFLGVGAIFHF